MGDRHFQEQEAKQVARDYRQRDDDPVRHAIARMQLEQGRKSRKQIKKSRTIII